MASETLKPQQILAESGTDDPLDFVRLGIAAAREEHFERGLIFLAEAYRRLSRTDAHIPPTALSYYGLCLALHKGRVKEAAEYCQLAIEREFYNAEHYANLGRVWEAGRSRRKAVEALDRGLAMDPRNAMLQQFRTEFGLRHHPVLPFLHRDNPLNVTLGRVRQTIKKKGTRKRR
jgi:tetratricopeptide (TPR) repeat protein